MAEKTEADIVLGYAVEEVYGEGLELAVVGDVVEFGGLEG
jgi:hypothetical protein